MGTAGIAGRCGCCFCHRGGDRFPLESVARNFKATDCRTDELTAPPQRNNVFGHAPGLNALTTGMQEVNCAALGAGSLCPTLLDRPNQRCLAGRGVFWRENYLL